MTKIGISYWGFCEKLENCNTANTPDGHRYGRPILVDDLNRRGHTVYALQKKRELSPYPGLLYAHDWFPDLDILFVEWRWSTYKNSGPDKFEPDLDRQIELLEYYYGKSKFHLAAPLHPKFCIHPIYQYAQAIDLKTDIEPLMNMSINELKKEMLNTTPKFLRTIRSNKAPIILDAKYEQRGLKSVCSTAKIKAWKFS